MAVAAEPIAAAGRSCLRSEWRFVRFAAAAVATLSHRYFLLPRLSHWNVWHYCYTLPPLSISQVGVDITVHAAVKGRGVVEKEKAEDTASAGAAAAAAAAAGKSGVLRGLDWTYAYAVFMLVLRMLYSCWWLVLQGCSYAFPSL